jgi:hypothetical protein
VYPLFETHMISRRVSGFKLQANEEKNHQINILYVEAKATHRYFDLVHTPRQHHVSLSKMFPLEPGSCKPGSDC